VAASPLPIALTERSAPYQVSTLTRRPDAPDAAREYRRAQYTDAASGSSDSTESRVGGWSAIRRSGGVESAPVQVQGTRLGLRPLSPVSPPAPDGARHPSPRVQHKDDSDARDKHAKPDQHDKFQCFQRHLHREGEAAPYFPRGCSCSLSPAAADKHRKRRFPSSTVPRGDT